MGNYQKPQPKDKQRGTDCSNKLFQEGKKRGGEVGGTFAKTLESTEESTQTAKAGEEGGFGGEKKGGGTPFHDPKLMSSESKGKLSLALAWKKKFRNKETKRERARGRNGSWGRLSGERTGIPRSRGQKRSRSAVRVTSVMDKG